MQAAGKKQGGTGRFPERSFYLFLFIFLLALGLRLLLWSAPLHQPANDEVEYIAVARDLLAGRGWQFYDHYHWLRAPLYPLFLAGSLWLAGGDPAGDAALARAALPNILLSVANVYLIYRLALALAGRQAALGAAAIAASLWTFATFASLYMAETLFTTLFMAGLLCLVRASSPAPPAWPRVALGGVLLGLATLTRSMPLLFLPAIALWLAALRYSHPGTEAQKQINPAAFSARLWASSIVFLLAAALTIAPWTVRNYRAYGRVIAVETGLSYNLWAFNEPREDGGEIFRALEQIANPAERADYATAKGLARLREDPAILLRKLWPNWVYLWRVKPIEDRFLQEHYYSDVPLPLFTAALVFDDGLYLLVALAGAVGLARALGEAWAEYAAPVRATYVRRLATPHALLIAWLLYAVGTMLLTHGEARYRHFLFPVLIPYAAWAVCTKVLSTKTPRQQEDQEPPKPIPSRQQQKPGVIAPWWSHLARRTRAQGLIGVAVGALLLGTFLAYYPWGWAGENLARGWYALRAERAFQAGDSAAALRLDEQALAAQRTPDGLLRLGDHARAAGEQERAIKAYRSARALSPGYTPAVGRLGDLYRAQGDLAAARRAFRAGFVDLQALTDWSWRELRPDAVSAIDVGDGLDYGYLGGVYPAELIAGASARWTNGQGLLRFGGPALPAGRRGLLRLRLAAPWPGQATVPAQVCAAGECTALELGPDWRTYAVPFVLAPGAAAVFELRSPTFAAPDGRRLGVVLSAAAWAEGDAGR